MKRKSTRKKSIILRVLVLGVSIYMVATSIVLYQGFDFFGKKIGNNSLASKKAEYEKLLLEKQTLELEITELRQLLDSDSHAEIIEKAARERLGYVYSDEEIYIDISGN